MILALGDQSANYDFANGSVGHMRDRFVPTKPAISVKEAARDSAYLEDVTRENVTERFRAMVMGTASGIQTFIHNIEGVFRDAAAYAESRVGIPKYIYYDATETTVTAAHRSQILYGTVTVTEDHISNGFALIDIELRRRFYWEGADTELSLTNTNIEGAYGQPFDNAHPTDHANLSSNEIGGVLPAPLRIEVTNMEASALGKVRLALAVFGGTAYTHYEATGGATHTDSTASGGSYETVVWSGGADDKILPFSLAPSQIEALNGRYYRVLLRLASAPPASTWLRYKLTDQSGVSEILAGDLTLLDTSTWLQDLGIVRLPPWDPGAYSPRPLNLSIYSESDVGGSLNADYMQLMPAEMYRELTPVGWGLEQYGKLVDDGIEGHVYAYDGGYASNYHAHGNLLRVWPGRSAVLYLKAAGNADHYEIDWETQVRVYYRPRRLTL